MSAELAEMNQRLAEMIRIGKVHSIDHETGRIRVEYGKGNVSAWIPWTSGRAGSVQESNPPAVGEQVTILNPSGTSNGGFALPGGIHKSGAAASAEGAYKLTFPESGNWEISIGALTLHADNGKFTVTVGAAAYEVSGGKHKFTGDMEVTGKITATVDVIGGGIHLKTHTHGGVESGGSNTSTPNP